MSSITIKHRQQRFFIVLAVFLVLFLAMALLSLSWGSYSISAGEIMQVFLGNGTKNQNTAILNIRLPRIIVGLLVAIALSTAGCILQTETKNDLADPGIIGINAGGATAAVLFIHLQTADYYSELGSLSIFLLPLMAIIGAFLAAAAIYLLSCRGGLRPKRLLLVGIGMNAGLNAVITFFTYSGTVGEYNRVLIWTSGSLWGSGWAYAKVLAPIVLVLFIYVLYHHKALDAMQFSDELVTGWGMNVNRERRKFLIMSVLLAGAATAFAGNIGFLGLVAPHIARRLVGPKHKYYIPVAALAAAAILLLADAVSRNAFSPVEIPAGITVSVIGVPYFIYLIFRGDEHGSNRY